MCSLSFRLVHFPSHGLLQFCLFVHIQYEFVLCDCAHRHHISFICSSSDGHPGCFQKLTVVSSAWRSMRIQASPSQDDVGSLGSRPGWGIVRSHGSSPDLVSITVVLISFLKTLLWSVPLPCSHQLRCFVMLPILAGVRWNFVVLICMHPMQQPSPPPFSYSSLGLSLFCSSVHILTGSFVLVIFNFFVYPEY